jgi:hypothetical protein
MKNSKKSAAGLVAAWQSFIGVSKRISKDLNAKTAVFYLLVMTLISD